MEKDNGRNEHYTEEDAEIEIIEHACVDHTKDTQKEIEHEETSQKKPRKKRWMSGLVGGMIGGIISAIIVVILLTSNILPNQQDINENGQTKPVNKESSPAITDLLSTDDQTSMSMEDVSKAVVGIVNLKQQNIWTPSEEAGSGSGIIYKKENGKAYVVTNNHVVEGAEEVEIDLNNEKRIKARVLGTDQLTDLAVLEVDASEIDVVANLGISEQLGVGETVFAIGNPLGMDFSGSVTKGIISGLNRSIQVDTNGDNQPDWVTEVIQTDAAINPGNSGGALINTDGEIIGINSMKIARSAVEGIGFAIPIDAALPIMEQLETNGEVSRPFIGITTAELNQVPQQYRQNISLPEDVTGGMVVADVQPGSPADVSGLKQFDVITTINGQEISSLLDLRKYMFSEVKIGDTVDLEFYREGNLQHTQLELTERQM